MSNDDYNNQLKKEKLEKVIIENKWDCEYRQKEVSRENKLIMQESVIIHINKIYYISIIYHKYAVCICEDHKNPKCECYEMIVFSRKSDVDDETIVCNNVQKLEIEIKELHNKYNNNKTLEQIKEEEE